MVTLRALAHCSGVPLAHRGFPLAHRGFSPRGSRKKGDSVVSARLNQRRHASCNFSWDPPYILLFRFARINPNIHDAVRLPIFGHTDHWEGSKFTLVCNKCSCHLWAHSGVRYSTQDKLFQPCCHPGLWVPTSKCTCIYGSKC